MSVRLTFGSGLVALALLLGSSRSAAVAPGGQRVPLPRAHAHNDYEHPRPLLDALEHGFCSVEADVHLVDGQLLVAHDRDQVRADRTLERLYLEPLQDRVRRNRGRVYRRGPEFSLMIDIKGDAEATYAALRPVLGRYAGMLTRFEGDRVHRNAVTIVLSGNRPRQRVEAERKRYVALDGRLEDLGTGASAALVPWISSNWTLSFRWRGEGPMPGPERRSLREIVSKAHREGRRVRFWATPDSPLVWRELVAAKVDLINTDDLPGLQRFLTTTPAVNRGTRVTRAVSKTCSSA